MVDFKDFKKDKNGFYVLDKKEVKVGSSLSSHKHVVPVSISGECYYFKSQSALGSAMATIAKMKGVASSDAIADGDMFLLSEIYYSKLARKMGITTVDYHLAKLNGRNGVISNDFVDMQRGVSGDLYEVLGDNHVEFRDDMKYLHAMQLFHDCEPSVVDDIQTLSMFDYTTFQLDRNDGNVALAMDGSNKFNKVIALDYSNNGVAIDYLRSEDKFKGLRSKHSCVRLGIEMTDSNEEKYLSDISTSPYVRGRVINNYLSVLNDALKGDKIFVDIHSEIAEEYNIGRDVALDRFEARLRDTMTDNGEKLQMAYDRRELSQEMEK